MRTLHQLFTEHPATVDETYLQHLGQALGFSAAMLLGGLACLVHAFLPFLFLTRGSDTIRVLHDRMVTNRRRVAAGKVATGQTAVQ
jgi:hypothetical protein